jgi:1-deoxy-D-xylulose-5-phosphate reductoisomerase
VNLSVLGSTGSIGVSTLDVVARHPERFRVQALSANRNDSLMLEQCRRFNPRFAVMVEPAAGARLQAALGTRSPTQVLVGPQALVDVAALDEVDAVMAAIVGAAGLLPTLAAAEAGKRLLLANKEALVMSGRLLMDAVRRSGAELLPIDSEHNAVFQCLPRLPQGGLQAAGVSRILLTASGGPFRSRDPASLAAVTPEEACAHPNWSMGRKISVDSATMMNKGLEVIEACWLFDASPEQVDVVVHPQSVIHSMVQYRDGSVLAQLGNPDMRTPIAHALAWPERVESGVAELDLIAAARLDFQRPDFERFPCLDLAYRAARAGSGASGRLNAANEVAVAAFLERRIGFPDIAAVIDEVMVAQVPPEPADLEQVLAIDAEARRCAGEAVERRVAARPRILRQV